MSQAVQLFYSRPARLMIYLAIPVILVTQYTQFNTTSIFIQALTYAGIAYNAECLIEGGCDIWAWISVLLPVVYSLLYIFFGGQLNLVPIPPSPITNILPVKRGENKETSETSAPLADTIIYTDDLNAIENIDSILAANSQLGGEPANNSAQPSVSNDTAETFYI